MEQNTGWIRVYRSIKNHWIFKNPDYLRAWLIILMEVNYTTEEKKVLIDGEIISCNRGEKIYSINTWIEKFGKGWTRQRVRTFFKLLEKDAMIQPTGLRKTTKLTVINYDIYQGLVTNSQPTEQPTANQQPTHSQPQYKKDKKDKKEKEERMPSTAHQKNEITLALQTRINKEFPQVAKLPKQITDSQLEGLLEKYKKSEIIRTLEAMENYKDITKKYTSVGLTLKNWIGREYGA